MPSVEQMINTAQYGYGVMETALTDATNLITRVSFDIR